MLPNLSRILRRLPTERLFGRGRARPELSTQVYPLMTPRRLLGVACWAARGSRPARTSPGLGAGWPASLAVRPPSPATPTAPPAAPPACRPCRTPPADRSTASPSGVPLPLAALHCAPTATPART